MAAQAGDPFEGAPAKTREFLARAPQETREWLQSIRQGSRPGARIQKIRELEEENKKLKDELQQRAIKEAGEITRQAKEQIEKMKREAEEQAKKDAQEIKQKAEKEAEEIRQKNRNLQAELEKMRQELAENIRRQLNQQYAREMENLRVQSEERLKQETEQRAKEMEELQAQVEKLKQEAELRQHNTAGTDEAFWDEGGPAPTPRIPDADFYMDESDVANASPVSGSPKIQSRVSSPLSTLPDNSPNSPASSAFGIGMPDPSRLDIMSGATNAASASGNPGVQTLPGSPALHAANPSGFDVNMFDTADTASAGDNTVMRPSSSSPQSFSNCPPQDAIDVSHSDIDMPNIADTADTADTAGAASAGGGPEIQWRVSNPPSSPAQHPADTPGLGVGMPDTADAVSASKTIIDVDALELQGPRSILTMPNFKGPYSKRLDTMIKWGNVQFPEIGFNEFGDGRFIRAGVFHELSTGHSWFVTEHSQTHPLSKAGISKTNPSKVHPLLNAVQSGKYSFAVVLCPVRLRPEDPVNHFVVAIVDWREEGRNLHGGSRRGRSGRKSGKFTHWGMGPGLAETLRNDCEQILGLSLESCEKKLTYTGNTCLLQCFGAVLSYEGKACPKADDDPSAIRVFFLQKQLERLVSQNNEAVSRVSQNNSCGHTTADTKTATAEGPTQHGDEATVEDLGSDGSALQHHQSAGSFSSAQFALLGKKSTRTPLPSGPAPKTKARAASPLPSDPDESAPPPPSGQGINSPATHNGVKYQWMPCDGGEVLVLQPTPAQYSDLKEGPEDDSPLLFTVAEELGARTQGAFLITTPKECRPVLPPQTVQTEQCTTYKPEPVKDDFWQLFTLHATQSFTPSDGDPSNFDSNLRVGIKEYTERLSEASKKNRNFEGVGYQTDIPARTAQERKDALLPLQSPIWHIRGNKLPREGVPGLHTPTAYRGTKHAPFAWHSEDYKLSAFNYLYYGRKAWNVIPPELYDKATEVFREALGVEADHDQFLRHCALHCGIEHLRSEGVPTIVFRQSPWQMVVVYSGAYHSGFSETPTFAEAINFADSSYTIPQGYTPCGKKCRQGHAPITLGLIFPPEAKTIPANEEAGSTPRRSSRRIATSHPAPANGPMASPNVLQKRRHSTCEGRSAGHERAKPQNKSRDESQDEAMSEPQGTPENNSTAEPDEPRVKRNKVDIQGLADVITGQQAKKRFRDYVLAWIDHSALELLPKQDSNRLEQPLQYLDAGWRLQAQGPFLTFVGLTFTTYGIEKMYPNGITPGMALPRLPNGAIESAMAKLCLPMTKKSFNKKLEGDRALLMLGVPYLAFIPVGGDSSGTCAATLADFRRLSNAHIKELREKLARSPEAQTMAKVGRAFRNSILQGDSSVWTSLGAENIKAMDIDEFWRVSLGTVREGED
ncbi:hypothetical protein RB600_000610 [Gaeumannomyces tritici]